MKNPEIYIAVTNFIKVSVVPIFLPEESSVADSKYVWAYNVLIENLGNETVQLLTRHWKIINDQGDLQEVKGPGVIGKQPVLKPSEIFQYTSGTFLNTPSGMMMGEYQMKSHHSGEHFHIAIPAFSLDSPFADHRPS